MVGRPRFTNKAGMSFRMNMIHFAVVTSPDLAWKRLPMLRRRTRKTHGQDAHATRALPNEAGMCFSFCEMYAAGPLPIPDLGARFEINEKTRNKANRSFRINKTPWNKPIVAGKQSHSRLRTRSGVESQPNRVSPWSRTAGCFKDFNAENAEGLSDPARRDKSLLDVGNRHSGGNAGRIAVYFDLHNSIHVAVKFETMSHVRKYVRPRRTNGSPPG
jgi:hypothetical protein